MLNKDKYTKDICRIFSDENLSEWNEKLIISRINKENKENWINYLAIFIRTFIQEQGRYKIDEQKEKALGQELNTN